MHTELEDELESNDPEPMGGAARPDASPDSGGRPSSYAPTNAKKLGKKDKGRQEAGRRAAG